MIEHFVGIGQAFVDDRPESVFISRALGSCVAVAIYSPFTKVGGMAHVLLPGKPEMDGTIVLKRQVARRAEGAVSYLVSEIGRINRDQYGHRSFVLRAKIAGGADMFPTRTSSPDLLVGFKNVISVKEALKARNIVIKGEDVGGNHGRNVYFYLGTGRMEVRKINGEVLEL